MAKKETITSEKIRFYCRFAFTRLDEPKQFDGKGDPRWECTGLLDPSDPKCLDGIKLIVKTAADISKKGFDIVPLELRKVAAIFIPGQAAPDLKAKEDGIEVAFYNGDKKEYDGFEGMFVIPAHNSMLKPGVANRKGKAVEPGDPQFPYSGAYGYMSVTLWVQDNQYGKRIGVNLRGAQFAKDGEAFGVGDIVPEEEFDALEDSGEDATADDDIGF